MSKPRVVVGIPLYESGEHMADALESLFEQTYREVAFVLLDDASENDAAQRARSYALRDPRVSLHRSEHRLGLCGAWQRVLELSVREHPGARWFAWGSDHDVWHPRFLEALVAELSSAPGAVLAYPLVSRFGQSLVAPPPPWRFDTRGEPDRMRRLALTARRMVAGDMIYGLFERRALLDAGGFPAELMPDRLVLTRLALAGEFRQVPEVLWSRRMTEPSSIARQRRSLFGPDGAPARARLPWWVTHAGKLGRAEGPGAALGYGFPSARMAGVNLVRRSLGRTASAMASAIRTRAGG